MEIKIANQSPHALRSQSLHFQTNSKLLVGASNLIRDSRNKDLYCSYLHLRFLLCFVWQLLFRTSLRKHCLQHHRFCEKLPTRRTMNSSTMSNLGICSTSLEHLCCCTPRIMAECFHVNEAVHTLELREALQSVLWAPAGEWGLGDMVIVSRDTINSSDTTSFQRTVTCQLWIHRHWPEYSIWIEACLAKGFSNGAEQWNMVTEILMPLLYDFWELVMLRKGYLGIAHRGPITAVYMDDVCVAAWNELQELCGELYGMDDSNPTECPLFLVCESIDARTRFDC